METHDLFFLYFKVCQQPLVGIFSEHNILFGSQCALNCFKERTKDAATSPEVLLKTSTINHFAASQKNQS